MRSNRFGSPRSIQTLLKANVLAARALTASRRAAVGRLKACASRLETKQNRAELIKAGLRQALPGIRYLGLWLVLADGWWTQT